MAETRRSVPLPRREKHDVGERFIYGAVAAMLGLLIVCALGTLWLYPQSRLDRTLSLPLPNFPEPMLQIDPAADMNAFYAREMRTLEGRTGSGRPLPGRVPIGEAMRRTVRDGIPGWPP